MDIIVTVNQQAITCNHDAVIVDGQSIIINHDCNLEINYLDNINFDVQIQINANINLYEQYNNTQKIILNKTIIINQDCFVQRYVNNQSNHEVEIHETVILNQNADIKVAYVEMSDSQLNMNLQYDLIAAGSNAQIRFGAISKVQENKYIKISMNHLSPNTSANMDNYGVVKDQGELVIDGICTIKKGMYQSSSHQVNKIIVFDQGANAKANPYLYIDEYDVKASHGASVGKIDEDHLYYLQSRGLSRHEAMALVMYGYFTPVIEYIFDETLQEQFLDSLKDKVGI